MTKKKPRPKTTTLAKGLRGAAGEGDGDPSVCLWGDSRFTLIMDEADGDDNDDARAEAGDCWRPMVVLGHGAKN